MLEVRKENAPMTATLIRSKPKCDLSLTKAALSSVGSAGVLFQPPARPPWPGRCLPRGAGQARLITSLGHSGALCTPRALVTWLGREAGSGAGGQEGGNDWVKTSTKGECFGNPKGSVLARCVLKVLPKEAA